MTIPAHAAPVTLLAVLATAPALAASLEVRVRDGEGRPMARERVVVHGDAGGSPWRRQLARLRGRSAVTDADGRATFEGLAPGAYTVDVPWPARSGYLPPAENPFAAAPRVSLFDDGERLEVELELRRGLRVTALIELPDDDTSGFRARFRHRESGRELVSAFPHDSNLIERLLVPGVWEVSVEPPPGYLLVGVERGREPVPGHRVRLDLVQEPESPYLTWTFAAPCRLEGAVTEAAGRSPAVTVEAALVEPGPWHEAALARGGSRFERVTAYPDPFTGRYEMVLPDGAWSVRPVGEWLLESEPETVDLALAPGEAGRADFTVRLGGSRAALFTVTVVGGVRWARLPQAPVAVFALDDPTTALRTGTTGASGSVSLPALEEGSYRVAAGHEDFLEGRLELPDYDPKAHDRPRPRVVLPSGARIRLEARGPDDRPLAGAELTVERLGGAPETLLQDADFLAAKTGRTAATDRSGRTTLPGFYPGTYRARVRPGGQRGGHGLIRLGLRGQTLLKELEFEVRGEETVDLEARMQPAARLTASLVCADGWALPDAASARVFEAAAPVSEIRAGDGADESAALAVAGVPLTGRGRDTLEIGPLEQGVYRLAIRPAGFDRWTWAFGTRDPAEATEVQVTVEDRKALGEVDLGVFEVECAPAVDLLPAVATGDPFPDLGDVRAAARVLDPEAGHEISRPPALTERAGRFRVRGLPRGRQRLEVTLTHPHFLPGPSLTWPIDLELERGQFREVVAEVEALGGAIRLAAPVGAAALHGPWDEPRRLPLEDGQVTFPSLVPGRYRLELFHDAGEPIRVWPELDVRAGETLLLPSSHE